MNCSGIKTSLLMLWTVAGVLTAQTPRLSLYEEFTGETCQPCAAVNPALNTLLLTPGNQQKIVAIKWQVPIPSSPTNTWSLYQTNKTEIDWRHKGWDGGYTSNAVNPPSVNGYGYPSQYTGTSVISSGINSAPSGRIDGQHQWEFGALNDHPGSLTQSVINTAQSYTSAFALTLSRSWNSGYGAVTLTVSITASAGFTAAGSLKFRCVMVEREILFPVQPGTNGEKFFEDVAIRSFPDIQNGVSLPSAWSQSQNVTFTLNCILPSYVRDKSKIAFVGFVQDDGNRKVAQAARADVDPLPNDAMAVAAIVAPFSCSASVVPAIAVKNVGTTTITALTITPFIDGVAQSNFGWTGSLAGGATTTISGNNLLPASPGGHVLTFSISGVSGGDANPLNNSTSKTFYLVTGYPSGTPVVQSFSVPLFPEPGYHIVNSDDGPSWSRHGTTNGTSVPGGLGAAVYDFYNNTVISDQDELLLPPVRFPLADTPKLTFDVAYAQRSAANPENDQLEVKVSNDCGLSWTTIYSKSGNTLSTKSPQAHAFVPSSPSHWRRETVMLSGFDSSDVIVKFVTTSDSGNNLYIDNINLRQGCIQQSVTVSANRLVVCIGEDIQLTAGGASSYIWSNKQTGSVIAVPTNSAHSTVYTVKSADSDGCGDSAYVQVTIDNCVGVAETERTNPVLFPNPNNGEFLVRYSGSPGAKLVIYNTLGQVVGVYTVPAGVTSIRSGLKKGVYTFALTVKNGAYRARFIVE